MELDTPPPQHSPVAGGETTKGSHCGPPTAYSKERAGPGGDSRGRLLWMPQSVEGMQGG